MASRTQTEREVVVPQVSTKLEGKLCQQHQHCQARGKAQGRATRFDRIALCGSMIAVMVLAGRVQCSASEEHAAKKLLTQQAKQFIQQAKDLEKAGQLLEARKAYAQAQSFAETPATQKALRHIDEKLQQQTKTAIQNARKLYDQRKFKQAAETLAEAIKLGREIPVLFYDLALCHKHLGDLAAALGYLDEAAMSASDPKQRLRLNQLRTAWTTGEMPGVPSAEERDRVRKLNQMIESVGFEISLEGGGANSPDSRRNLCKAVAGLATSLADRPSVIFNRANCEEMYDHPAEAARLLQRYLQVAPNAADAELVRLRMKDLEALTTLTDEAGPALRNLYAIASRAIEGRKYDRVLAAYGSAAEHVPGFAPTHWRLALTYEAIGNVEQARQYFTQYRKITTESAAQAEADLHLATLEAKRDKYDEEVAAAEEILADLLNRAMNLTFNALQDRAALYKLRDRQRRQAYQKKQFKFVGGFTVPLAYAQQQLAEAAAHLSTALALCPFGAEANGLMGLVLLQANDGRSAMRSFDAVASQNLPVSFYAEMRGHKQDRAVKCELTRDRLQLIFLSSYDKHGKPIPPASRAGEDGLGDLVMEPSVSSRQGFESVIIRPAEIKQVETKDGHLVLKLLDRELTLSPIYLGGMSPTQGPAARRFGNNYTRLFVRYPGLEESKLGNEGLTGFEKLKLAYEIGSRGMSIAFNANPIGAVAGVQDFIAITKKIQGVSKSLRVNYAEWERTVEDRRTLQAGNAFKLIPTEAEKLGFVEKW